MAGISADKLVDIAMQQAVRIEEELPPALAQRVTNAQRTEALSRFVLTQIADCADLSLVLKACAAAGAPSTADDILERFAMAKTQRAAAARAE